MTPAEERELMRQWVQAWKEAGPELEAIRREEVRTADNHLSLRLLEPAFNHAVDSQPIRETSGLIDMQRWLAKMPR